MKKYSIYLFIILIFGIIIMVSAKFNFQGTISEREKRELASSPHIFSNGALNFNIFSDIDNYLMDRFGFRVDLINLNNWFNYKVLNKSGNARAILGKDGWLFYLGNNNLQDFMRINLVSDEQAESFAQAVKKRFDWCEANGIELVFIIAPNKHNIYPEKYPIDRPSGITRSHQYAQAMDKAGLKYIYPLEFLWANKDAEPLYYETDTHWNQRGAYLTFQLLKERVAQLLPNYQIPQYEYNYTVDIQPGGGDITPMLGFIKYGKITKIYFNPEEYEWDELYKYEKNEGRSGVRTIGDSNLPKAIVFRDSFMTALQPFVSTMFSDAIFHWTMFSEEYKAQILENKPDIIIWEVVERLTPGIVKVPFN